MNKHYCECGNLNWPGHKLCHNCEQRVKLKALEAENAALKAQLEAVKAWFKPLDINWDAIEEDE
jgi:hypothetical protein